MNGGGAIREPGGNHGDPEEIEAGSRRALGRTRRDLGGIQVELRELMEDSATMSLGCLSSDAVEDDWKI